MPSFRRLTTKKGIERGGGFSFWIGALMIYARSRAHSFRIISCGAQRSMLTSNYPIEGQTWPLDDEKWVCCFTRIESQTDGVQDTGDLSQASHQSAMDAPDGSAGSFARLCHLATLAGAVLSHDYESSSELVSENANRIFNALNDSAISWTADADKSLESLLGASATGLAFRSLFTFCNAYLRASSHENANAMNELINGGALKIAAQNVVKFADNIANAAGQDLSLVSPIMMDALYSAAVYFAWLMQNGDDEAAHADLESIRQFLTRFSSRWRNAAEYSRILEAKLVQDFSYAVGGATS